MSHTVLNTCFVVLLSYYQINIKSFIAIIIALNIFSFLLSVLFSKAKVASACSGIIYFLTYLPFAYMTIQEFLLHETIAMSAKICGVRIGVVILTLKNDEYLASHYQTQLALLNYPKISVWLKSLTNMPYLPARLGLWAIYCIYNSNINHSLSHSSHFFQQPHLDSVQNILQCTSYQGTGSSGTILL